MAIGRHRDIYHVCMKLAFFVIICPPPNNSIIVMLVYFSEYEDTTL